MSGSIVLNVDIFKSRLKERVCSINIELDGARVNFREAFFSVHTKIFKASSVVLVQKDDKLTGSFELLNSIFFGYFEKGVKLVIPFLKMVKTSILFDDVSLKLFDEVPQLLYLI